MLWILSGSYHSGKNTVRNILAEEFGFKIICKYVLQSTAGTCFEFYNTDLGITENRARRDPYLVTIANEEDKNFLNQMEQAESPKVIQNIKNEIERTGRIIYDKSSGDSRDYYFIYINDIEDAVESDDNYLLVCSNPDVIGKILQIDSVSNGRTRDRVKTIMLFGINLDTEVYNDNIQRENALEQSATKIKDFFRSKDYLQRFDFILFNRPCESLEQRRINIIYQWEIATNNLDKSIKPVKLQCSNGQLSSSIFFVKPFSAINADLIYKEVNKVVKDKCHREVYSTSSQDRRALYYLGGDTPLKTVEYETTDYPQDQMRDQIEQAGLVVVDVAGRLQDDSPIIYNPNCFWELGYARAKNKRILIICDNDALPLPFDENVVVFPYTVTDGQFQLLNSNTGLSFIDELKNYFDYIRRSFKNRVYHQFLIQKSREQSE